MPLYVRYLYVRHSTLVKDYSRVRHRTVPYGTVRDGMNSNFYCRKK
jgi:hypothetical protein